MRKIWILGLNTFREAIRNKVLYSLLMFAVGVIFASLAFGSLSIRDEARLTLDLGVSGMSLFALIISVFVGVNLVYKELDRKTIYTLIPKPIHRYQFIVGKYLGLVITLAVQLLAMTITLGVVLLIQDIPLRSALLMMVLLIFLEVLVITAIAMVFSSFSTPLLSGLFTVGVFVVGRNIPDIREMAEKIGGSLGSLLAGVTRVVPNLRYFFVTGTQVEDRHVTVSGVFVDWAYMGTAASYALLYVAVGLILAAVLFSRRDFV